MPPGRGPTATQLVQLALDAGAEPFTHEGRPYLRVREGDNHETFPLGTRGTEARQWLHRLSRRESECVPGPEALDGALGALAAEAGTGPERSVWQRVGRPAENAIVIDRGTPDHRAFVVGPGQWAEGPSPIDFLRSRKSLELPGADHDGAIESLRPFINLDGESDWYLTVAWLVAALWPEGPYPLLLLSGQAGTAKSTAARVLRALVDPSRAPIRALPRDVRNLAVAARWNRCLVFDNVSSIPTEISDALCQLSTGGGFAHRKLYTDDEEEVFTEERPVIVTSIEQVVVRGDLLDRAILIELPVIPRSRQQAEADFWRDFGRAKPAILGGLLGVVARVLALLPDIHLSEMPRMADFARLGVAVEGACRWPPGSFLDSYGERLTEASEEAVAASPIGELIVGLAKGEGCVASSQDLLQRLSDRSGRSPVDLAKDRAWPTSPRALSGQLKRLAPDLLRAHSVIVARPQRTSSKRLWSIRIDDAGSPS